MSLDNLFIELTDLPILPNSLHITIHETLDITHSLFTGYYSWAVHEIISIIQKGGYDNIYELGCGTAPLTRALVKDQRLDDIKLIPCDLRPNVEAFKNLQEAYPNRIEPSYESFNYSKKFDVKPNSLLILSGTFHHIHKNEQVNVLRSLLSSNNSLLILEPVRKNLISIIFCLFGFIPGFLLPLIKIRENGLLRRIIWCWLLPLGPLVYSYDGIMSSLRELKIEEWGNLYQELNRTDIEYRAINIGMKLQKIIFHPRD